MKCCLWFFCFVEQENKEKIQKNKENQIKHHNVSYRKQEADVEWYPTILFQ